MYVEYGCSCFESVEAVLYAGPEAAGIHSSWVKFFLGETKKAYFKKLMAYVAAERSRCVDLRPKNQAATGAFAALSSQ